MISHTTASGHVILLDDEDAWILDEYCIICRTVPNIGVRAHKGGQSIALARLIICVSDDAYPDHIDRDPLNNCRSNLRAATRSQNNHNRENWGAYPKGISYDAHKRLYRARIQVDGRRIGLGRYQQLQDAVDAYNKAAREMIGEFAGVSYAE